MARFYGKIGFGTSVKTAPGVYEDVISTRKYIGDVLRNTRRLEPTDQVNSNVTVGNSISVVADAHANQNFHAIRYVEWMGTNWTVSDVEVQDRRLVLRLGEVYNGPTEPAPVTA